MNRILALFNGLAVALLIGIVGSTSALARDLQVQQIEPDVALPSVDAGEVVDETPDLWFVELSSKPAVDGTKLRTLRNEKAAFRSAAKKAGLEYTERYAFDQLWNGLSIQIDPGSLNKLAQLPGVANLYPVVSFSVPEPTIAKPNLGTAITMTGADIAQSGLGLTGEGMKVAVMDTGIDYDHPDLGGCFGTGCRVEYGWDFVGDAYNADPSSPSYNPVPAPDDDPDDCQGHGTHVAGIVGANGAVVGVAPDVTFGAYRVFGCDGSTEADIMIAAMEMALADGMDVLNMSIGSTYQWPQYPTAQASDRMVNHGMVVVASIGNSGSTGTYSAGAPGVGKKVIGVASFDNTHSFQPYFEVGGTKIAYNGMSFADPAPTSGTEEVVFVGRGCDIDPYLADPAGKVALIMRGACSFNEKATNALNAGATAAIVHNSGPGNFNGTLGSYVPIATVSISLEDGLFIRGQATPTMMTWTDQLDSFPSPTGGLISGFSSYGLAPDLSFKPDIGAPGGSIYSTYVMEKSNYATLGGTSMASPHTAGAAALLLQAHPNTPAQKVRRILQNSADPAPWNLAPGIGFYDSVHRQGAGMLDVDDAITATTHIEPGKIALGESEGGPSVHMLTLENKGDADVTYDLTEEWYSVATTGTVASSLGYWLSDGYLIMPASVTVPADGTATVSVTFVPPTGPGLSTYGGYIAFTPQGGGQQYRVPYAGFDGDYQDVSVLNANPFGLPLSVGCESDCTMEGDDVASFWVNFGHQSRKFRMEVFDANTGRAWHRVFDLDYFGRNSAHNSIFTFKWDGTTFNGKNKVNVVPDGDYEVVISVLKAGGDDNNPDHWETWTSPVITIARP
jgi:subtilisin family serine protease